MTGFTTRQKSYEYLRDHWKDAVIVQILIILCEILLILFAAFLPGNIFLNTGCVLLLDLLLISPLKVGRALFFETLTFDGDAAQLSLLFRYYRHGYEKTVGWRITMWSYRLLLNLFFSIPSAVLFALSDYLSNSFLDYTDRIFSMACFGFGLLFLVCSLVATEIVLLRFVFVPYLFAHSGTLHEALTLSRSLAKTHTNTLVCMYLDHAVWIFAIPLILPWFFTSVVFQTARAATLHRFLRVFPMKNTACILQPRKKYGRIGR